MRCTIRPGHALLIGVGMIVAGCGRSVGTIEVPEWDHAAASHRALTEFDANVDGILTADELKECPGLFSAREHFDRNGDGAIAAEELSAGLHEMQQEQAALVEVTCTVTRDGRPLGGAIVKFVPEPFMGDAFEPASGITARDGTTYPTVAEEKLPEAYRGRIHGMHCGIYRVEVTHPQIPIPAKFNIQTEVGRIVTRRSHGSLIINL